MPYREKPPLETHPVADSGLVRGTVEMCTIKEIIYVLTEAWLERGGGAHFQPQQDKHWRKQTVWRRWASTLSKRHKRDSQPCSSSHNFVLVQQQRSNWGIILLEQQVTKPSWRRLWLCCLSVQPLPASTGTLTASWRGGYEGSRLLQQDRKRGGNDRKTHRLARKKPRERMWHHLSEARSHGQHWQGAGEGLSYSTSMQVSTTTVNLLYFRKFWPACGHTNSLA